jgi:hypothetical protein
VDIHLLLEMSISREEFARLLPAAVGRAVSMDEDGSFRGSEAGRSWSIRLLALPQRDLGSVRLPRHQVEIRFGGFSQPEADAFMLRFHRGFLRGGG